MVGTYEKGKSFYGVYAMAGNVLEWVADLYDVYPGGDPFSSTLFGQGFRVLRGGAWNNIDFNVRSAFRNMNIPSHSNDNIGFRCAIDASK